MTGQTFGRLTVIGRSSFATKGRAKKWECQCSCGAVAYVDRGNLTSGNSTSCGCARRESAVKVRVGDVYGRLTVLERLPNFISGGRKFSYWKCGCSCGGASQVIGTSLIAGNSQSCGCLRDEAVRKNGLAVLIDLSGKTFGWLTVTRRARTPVCKPPRWLCECRCGAEAIVAGSSLTTGNTVSCGCAKASRSVARADGVRAKTKVFNNRRRAVHRQAYRPFDQAALAAREKELAELAIRLERETGQRWDIDHTVPLAGPYSRELGCRLVCGLHNEHNLQLLRHSENTRKKNFHWPGMW